MTILNTLDHLGKFDGKADEGFFVGYSLNSKAFRVYNTRKEIVEENLHVEFLEDKSNVEGQGPKWLFDLEYLTNSMNYVPFVAETNDFAGSYTTNEAELEKDQNDVIMPIGSSTIVNQLQQLMNLLLAKLKKVLKVKENKKVKLRNNKMFLRVTFLLLLVV